MLSIYSVPSVYCCSLLEYKLASGYFIYKIVTTYRGVFQKKKKIGSPGRCFAEPPNEYITRARGEASRNGTREVSWRTEIYILLQNSSCRDVWNHDEREIRRVTRRVGIYQMPLLNLGQWRCVTSVCYELLADQAQRETHQIFIFPLYAFETWLWFTTALRLHREKYAHERPSSVNLRATRRVHVEYRGKYLEAV